MDPEDYEDGDVETAYDDTDDPDEFFDEELQQDILLERQELEDYEGLSWNKDYNDAF
jgi:hypothetical protein